MGTLILVALAGLLALGAWFFVARGFELKRLLADGVEAQGTIVSQFKTLVRKSQVRTNHYLRYRYNDGQGRQHEYKFRADRDFWEAHPEGAAIDIVYSKSKPSVSAPRFLVEQARRAMRKTG